jgi:hypothetical protein
MNDKPYQLQYLITLKAAEMDDASHAADSIFLCVKQIADTQNIAINITLVPKAEALSYTAFQPAG